MRILGHGRRFIDVALCVDEIRRLHGGVGVAYDGEIVGRLLLPFAGLLSTGSVESVDAKLRCLHAVMGEVTVLNT